MTTTTDHIKALLVNDGREFAMIRKADLAALAWAVEGGIYKDRYLDHVGWQQLRIADLEKALIDSRREAKTYWASAQKHGEERRRYMANNKALMSRVDQQDYAFAGLTRQWEGQRRTIFDLFDALEASSNEFVALRCKLRRFKRKFPAIGALMDVTP